MDYIYVAVIGCGTIANAAHIPAYMKNEKVKIKYFCDIIPERAAAAVEKYGCGTAVTDYHDILNDKEVTAVSVCTPNNVHAQITVDFLENGKNVLCEKPASTTYENVLLMKEAKHKYGKILNIGVVNRFNDGVNRIRDYIQSGKLGEVFHVYVSFRRNRCIPGLGGAFTTKEISGGGVLIDWGVHFLDIVMYCCGDPEPVSVSGEAFCRLGKNIADYTYTDMWAGPPEYNGTYNVEDSVTGIIRTNGPVISFNGAWAQNIAEDEMYIDFMGDKAGIRLHYGSNFEVFTVENGALVKYSPEYNSTDHFENEINAFVDEIITNKPLPSDIDTVAVTAKILQAIYDSAEQHREIRF